jgi:hypothetical protein
MVFGQLGSVLAPLYINFMLIFSRYTNPLIAIGILGVLGLLITCFIKESPNIPEDFTELELINTT